MRKPVLLAASLMALASASPLQAQSQPVAENIVLVHGAVLDGSGWRNVHDLLVGKGLTVTVVQLPLTSLEADVAATKDAIGRTNGPTVLVGSSYGGAVISVAGVDPQVAALVYVAALQPDVGETVGELNARWPMDTHGLDLGNATTIVDPDYFHAEVAADLPQDYTAFMAASQRPTSFSIFTTPLPEVAWRDKPSYAIVATLDRTLNPDMLRFLYERSGAEVVELKAAHLPHISQPATVVDLILRAAGRN